MSKSIDNLIVTQDTEKGKGLQEWVVAPDADAEAQFLVWLEAQDRSEATVRAYGLGLRQFGEWFTRTTDRGLDPVLVTPLDVRSWRNFLRDERKLSAASVNNYLAGLRAFCAWAQRTGRAATDPTSGIRGVKVAAASPKWLTRPEQYRLLRACEEVVQLGELRARGDGDAPGAVWPKRDRALVRLLLAAGLRRAEAAALDVGDLEIRARSGWVLIRNGKGGKARRVPLNRDARKALRGWLDVRPEPEQVRETLGGALFVSQKGGRLTKRGVADRVAVLADRAGLEGCHAHTLRHTCAKNLVDAGVGIEQVAKVLGHSNLETTMIYTQPSEADLQRAVELVCWED